MAVCILQPNFVPSISAVTGQYTPGRYIWRLGVGLMSAPRLLDSFLSYKFFAASLATRETCYSMMNKINWFCFVAEYISLFALSYVSMLENFRKLYNKLTHVHCAVLYVTCVAS